MKTVRVALGPRSYDIVVGVGLLANAANYIVPVLPGKRVILVVDGRIAENYEYAKTLAASLEKAGIACDSIAVEKGEGSKSFAKLEQLCETILAKTPDRKTTIIALGGGVVGDLAGFAASILLRGLPFIQVPTTLLAQVDSSVGGKTAINAKAGKNLIGSFYQPLLVLADLDTLKTLDLRELRSGYAEIIKYGLIMDEAFYHWCLAHAGKLLKGDVEALTYAVTRSCQMKAEIVGADEKESAARALLNFGHTFGHALEIETGDWNILMHGEAVAIGMVMACNLSAQMNLIPHDVEHELADHFHALGIPSARELGVTWDLDKVVSHFVQDKKAEAGTLTFIVLDAVGKGRVVKDVAPALARAAAAAHLN